MRFLTHSKNSGFTLLEILVASAVIAMVSAMGLELYRTHKMNPVDAAEYAIKKSPQFNLIQKALDPREFDKLSPTDKRNTVDLALNEVQKMRAELERSGELTLQKSGTRSAYLETAKMATLGLLSAGLSVHTTNKAWANLPADPGFKARLEALKNQPKTAALALAAGGVAIYSLAKAYDNFADNQVIEICPEHRDEIAEFLLNVEVTLKSLKNRESQAYQIRASAP